MAGQNDFLIFNENKENMLAQEIYASDDDRIDGFKTGLARSNINNKVLHQTSVMCHAIGELVKDLNLTASDTMDTNELKANLLELFSEGGGSYDLFDVVEKDYILTFRESKGLALLGSYVYKEAVAGSRYGYPDFYNKVVAEKEAGTATETQLGSNTVTMYVNPNGHIFYDIANKGAVDAFYETYGIAWYYGVDTENERVFLPRNDWFTQNGTTDEIGKFINAGLPNITATFAGSNRNWDGEAGAYVRTTDWNLWGAGGSGLSINGVGNFDASRCSGVYGNSDTVQPKAVKKLFYMCVGNTEVSEAVTGITEVTTTENDTLPLLHHISADELLEHPSWLRSAGQWNDGNVYATVYNYLVNEYQTGSEHTDTLTSPSGTEYTVTYRTVKGKKVVDVVNVSQVDAVYNAIGSAWYYVINQDEMTFRLPVSHNSECYTSDPTRVGLDVSAGLPNITGNLGQFVHGGQSAQYTTGAFKTTYTSVSGSVNGSGNSYDETSFDASRSNPIYGNSDTVTPPHTEFYLYFKVANAVQNLELLDAGEVLEAVNNVVPNNKSLIASYGNPDYSAMVTTSTAPADGYFIVNTMVLQSNTQVFFYINGVGVADIDWVTSNTAVRYGGWMFRCSKGDVFSYTATKTSATPEVQFVPLKGAN